MLLMVEVAVGAIVAVLTTLALVRLVWRIFWMIVTCLASLLAGGVLFGAIMFWVVAEQRKDMDRYPSIEAPVVEARPLHDVPVGPSPCPRPAPAGAVVFAARHKHRFGSCSGCLAFTRDTVSYVSEKHSFSEGIGAVELNHDGIRDSCGKRWHFVIEGINVKKLLEEWKSGQDGADPGKEKKTPPSPASYSDALSLQQDLPGGGG